LSAQSIHASQLMLSSEHMGIEFTSVKSAIRSGGLLFLRILKESYDS